MFIPLHDGVPLRFMRAPYVTYALVALCIALYLLVTLRQNAEGQIAISAGFGLIPSVFFGAAQLPAELLQAPPWASPRTTMPFARRRARSQWPGAS